jgi:hypothetical protein
LLKNKNPHPKDEENIQAADSPAGKGDNAIQIQPPQELLAGSEPVSSDYQLFITQISSFVKQKIVLACWQVITEARI